MAKCKDCKGSGRYVGFTVAEDCSACAGRGEIPDWVSEPPSGVRWELSDIQDWVNQYLMGLSAITEINLGDSLHVD